MVTEQWSEEVLQLPGCRPAYGKDGDLQFVGPRVKFGIYEGIPTRVVPVRLLLSDSKISTRRRC